MRKLRSLVLALAVLASSGAAWAQPASPAEAARIARVEAGIPPVELKGEPPVAMSLQKWMETFSIPGASVAVFDHGKIVWAKGYGVKEAGSPAPVTTRTLFQAGSISKPVAAMAVLRQVEAGTLSLDENVNDRLVSWKVPENEFTKEKKVTLRRLLSHSAGTTVHGFPGYAVDEPRPTVVQVLNGEKPANTAPVRVEMVPGTKYQYSGGGVTIAQLLMTDVLKKPFPQIVNDAVIGPLGLEDSTYEQPLPPARAAMAATGHRADGKPVPGKWHVYPEMEAAGLWTTPSDLARIAIEVSKSKAGTSNKILSKEMTKQMLTVQAEPVGLGFFLGAGSDQFGHNGSDEGFQANLVAFSDSASGIAVMTNSDNGFMLLDRLAASAAKEYGWTSFRPAPDSTFVKLAILERLKGPEKALAWYRAARAAGPEKDFHPGDLNGMGYRLLFAGKVPAAIRVFQANVELNPQDWNGYDSLGEAYMTAGQKDAAIASYRKSIEMNPKNDNGKKMLEKLGVAADPAPERLAADTPKTTVSGNTFLAPAGWTFRVNGPATILEAPEGGSWLALVDVPGKDAEEAVAAAWKAYKPDAKWPLIVTNDSPDKDGWSKQRSFDYQTSPNEKRGVAALARFAGGVWTVVLYDMADAVGEKRGAQVGLVFGRLLPKGYARETFAGKKANRLDEKRLADLGRFVESGMKALKIPGVAVGIVQDGKVVFAGGYGVRALGSPAPVDGDTLFPIASNTKALTTLLLAKLVDEKKLTWETPVTTLLPAFKLGDAETTKRVLVKHLICACTGLPRQDMEMLFEFGGLTPETALATLGTMQPTSKFGELFQYSNPMAGAAGFMAGHVLFPEMELGAAYDRAMQQVVFDPLGMKATTFDYARALAGNHAAPHAPDVDGNPAFAVMELNYAIVPVRPAGGAWSSARDMLRYVQMELNEGTLPSGARYVEKASLLERRAPQVALGTDASYGMGLVVDATYGVPVVHHGGDLIGYHSDMLWLPGQNVGAVILTNGDGGSSLRGTFQRKLLEVLFDGHPEADARVAASAKAIFEQLAAERKLMTLPADPAESVKLASRYASAALGEIAVSRKSGATLFDFGEWKSEVASRKNPDGTISFLTTAPGVEGFEFVVGAGPKRTLVLRDAQHEYVFEER